MSREDREEDWRVRASIRPGEISAFNRYVAPVDLVNRHFAMALMVLHEQITQVELKQSCSARSPRSSTARTRYGPARGT